MTKQNLDETRLAEQWRIYKSSPTPALRATLVADYTYLVRMYALKYMRKKPAHMDFEDLLQAGFIGLLDAIEKFSPDRGNKFQTYASIRVNGAILDSINADDYTPRSVREQIRAVLRSIEAHYQENQREPTIGDIAERNQMEPDEVRAILGNAARTHMAHIDQSVMDIIGPTTDHAHTELSAAIKIVMDTALSIEERKFVEMKFFEGYTTREIAKELTLSTSAVKQLRENATAKLVEGLRGFEIDS